jgi:large subunit ribosomal protein L54
MCSIINRSLIIHRIFKRSESSVAKGTVLKGINVLKAGSDPIAKDDHEYPDWLWRLLDKKKSMDSYTPEEQLSWAYQRLVSQEIIRKNALLSKTGSG